MSLRMLRLSVVAIAALFSSTHANAQDAFQETERASRELLFEQRGAFGGLAEYAYLQRSWSVNTFYTVFRGQYPNQTRFWVVRRVTGAPGQAETVLWADSRFCAGVERALIAMEDLPSVRPDALQLGIEAENIGLVMDGAQHIFWNRWARSGRNDSTVGLQITGNVNSPIAEWWSAAAADLAPCWESATPQ